LNLPYRSTQPAAQQSTFLFIDSQADHATNKKLRTQKQGFLLKNYHRRKKQASIQRLKAPSKAAGGAPSNRLQIGYSSNEQFISQDTDSTKENANDGWVDEREISNASSNPSALRSEMWSLKAFLSQGYVDPFAASAVKMTDSMNLYFHHCTRYSSSYLKQAALTLIQSESTQSQHATPSTLHG
jgi:hypothetical protein